MHAHQFATTRQYLNTAFWSRANTHYGSAELGTLYNNMVLLHWNRQACCHNQEMLTSWDNDTLHKVAEKYLPQIRGGQIQVIKTRTTVVIPSYYHPQPVPTRNIFFWEASHDVPMAQHRVHNVYLWAPIPDAKFPPMNIYALVRNFTSQSLADIVRTNDVIKKVCFPNSNSIPTYK